MRIKQSFCYPCFKAKDTTLDTVFAAAAKIGLPAVEWWFRDDTFEETVALAKRHNLIVASICGHKTLTEGLNNPKDHDRILDELRVSIDLAVKHRIPNLICFSGNRQPGQSDHDALETVAAGLRRAAPYAEKHGINLNMELLNSKVDHPGYNNDHTAWGVKVCQLVNSPRVKLLYDIYHMQIMEGDLIRTLRDNIAHIGHFHTAGNPGRNDLDDTQELNYTAICRAIAQTPYAGYLGHEFTPRGDRLEALRRAFDICNHQ